MNEPLDLHDHARQKLWEAIRSLLGAELIENRLADAALFLVHIAPDEIGRLPVELRHRLRAVVHELTKHPAEREDEGSIHASASRLSDEEGVRIAREILSLYVELHGGI